MLTLEDIIRLKVLAQNLHNPPKLYGEKNLSEILDKSWFLAGDYGFKARNIMRYKKPIRKLNKNISQKIIINNTFRYISSKNYYLIHSNYQKVSDDLELVSLIDDRSKITFDEIVKYLNSDIKGIKIRTKKLEKLGKLIETEDYIWSPEFYFETMFPNTQIDNEILITKVLEKYPFLNIAQLIYLTFMDLFELNRIVSRLEKTKKILRGITYVNSPDELFCIRPVDYNNYEQFENNLKIQVSEINWEQIQPFVLEKKDPLVELIKLNKFMKFGEGNYWLFIEGIPQADFNLTKTKNMYKVSNLKINSLSKFELSKILDDLKLWGHNIGITIEINQIDDKLTKFAISITEYLINRGYNLQQDELKLRIDSKSISKKYNNQSNLFNWNQIGSWFRSKQFLEMKSNPDEILTELIQLDELESLCYRTGIIPGQINLSNFSYISGINYRLGYICNENLTKLLMIWPKSGPLSLIDNQIISLLKKGNNNLSSLEIQLHLSKKEINQHLLYLELIRKIKRDPSIIDLNHTSWEIFSKPVNDNLSNTLNSAEQINNLLKKILERNPPLTYNQLSRYLGIQEHKLKEVIQISIRKNEILEGYYMENSKDVQITLPEILDEINTIISSDTSSDKDSSSRENEANTPSYQAIDILPVSDPIAQIHLPDLLLNYPYLQLKQRPNPKSKWWIILWSGFPIGYFVLNPTNNGIIDYLCEIKIIKDFDQVYILSGIIQKIITIFRSWYNDEIFINEINNIDINNTKYEELHFIIESLGVPLKL